MATALVVNVPSTSINTEATIYTPTTGKTFKLLAANLACSAAGVAILKDGTGGPSICTITLEANKLPPYPIAFGPAGYTSAAVNNVLTAQGINGNLSGFLIVEEN